MVLRQKLVQAATAALYMGPLLAGLSGYGWAMLAPFLSVFLFGLLTLQPERWPQKNSEWLLAKTWVSTFSIVLSQLLLIAILIGIGRGIGGVMGFLPIFHLALPLVVSSLGLLILPLLRTDRKVTA